ncbi:MAG: phytanoyl-CoA dioxygenase family protein [Pseudomonadota bacterium]
MQAVDEIKEHGYIVLPDLITDATCAHLANSLDKACSRYQPLHADTDAASSHSLENKSGERVVYNLHNKDLAWFELFEHPGITAILDVLLRDGSYQNADPWYLNNNSARCPLPGGKPQQLHIDSRVAGLNRPLMVNVLWMIDDFTDSNGATRVVPGSHRRTHFAENGRRYEDEIVLTGRRGSAVVFDAGLWHGGTANTNGVRRWGLVLGYARWFIKPAFDFARNTPADLFQRLSVSQQRLLGFDSAPPPDEFTRVRRRSELPESPFPYSLPLERTQ